jgi:hypothetical protein
MRRTQFYLGEISTSGAENPSRGDRQCFVALYFLAGMALLTAYRVLMVWVYDWTESLLVATLMHGSLTASTIFVFTPAATGASFLIYISALAGAMWIVVAAVAWTSGGQLAGRPLQRRMA